MNEDKDELALDFAIYFIITALTNACAYGLVVVAGRALDRDGFGIFNSLTAIIAGALFFANTYLTLVTKGAALVARGDGFAFLVGCYRRVLRRGALPFLIAAALSPWIARLLGCDALSVIVTALAIWASFLSAAAAGVLAGVGLLRQQAYALFAGVAGRAAIGALLLVLLASIAGGVSGFIGNYLLVALIGFVLLARVRSPSGAPPQSPTKGSDGVTSAIYILGMMPLVIDQVLVQLIAPSLSGDYAAAALLAKLVFYASLPIIAVVYPRMLRLRDDPSAQTAMLRKALLLMFGVATVLGAACAMAAPWIIRLVLPAQFAGIAPDVRWFALATVCFSLGAMLLHFLVAIDAARAIPLLAVALALQLSLFALRHGSLAELVQDQLLANVAQALLLLAVTLWRPHPSP